VKTAKKAALGALAASVLAFVTPMTSASADQGDTLKGGCGFNTDEQATATNGQFQGVEYVLAFSQEAAGTPSTATVSCWIDVNGVEQPGTRITATGNGAIAGQAQISYSAVDGDAVNQCQQVTFADGSTWTASDGNVGTDCPAATQVTIPPQAVIDAINTVIDAINGVLALPNPILQSTVDPVVCPVLASLGPQSIGGVVTIGSDGDIDVQDPLGVLQVNVYDCPPYRTV
jgi:hypothetical protein